MGTIQKAYLDYAEQGYSVRSVWANSFYDKQKYFKYWPTLSFILGTFLHTSRNYPWEVLRLERPPKGKVRANPPMSGFWISAKTPSIFLYAMR